MAPTELEAQTLLPSAEEAPARNNNVRIALAVVLGLAATAGVTLGVSKSTSASGTQLAAKNLVRGMGGSTGSSSETTTSSATTPHVHAYVDAL